MERVEELNRLMLDDCVPEPSGWAARVTVCCEGDARSVLTRVKEVLIATIDSELDADDSESDWALVLPEWFVQRCGTEKERHDDSQSIGGKIQEIHLEDPWRVDQFVDWFRPEDRTWYWWCAEVRDDDLFEITLAISEFEIPWDVLKWLLRASGARNYELKYF